jgi:MFS family permease
MKLGIIIGAVMWAFIGYFIAEFGWWAFLVVPAFLGIAAVLLFVCPPELEEPFQTDGRHWL